jgi:Ca2+-binding RTX toxin-like protein
MTSCRRLSTLVIVDSAVADYQTLIQALPEANVLVLDRTQDGIAQITQALKNSTVKHLHILSHGSAGELQIGATRLNDQTLGRYISQLQQWAALLANRAEILLYGCEVAAGALGRQFIHKLKGLTGAEIAASTALTGNAALGGNWRLDFTTGDVEAPIVFPAAATAAYAHVLILLTSDTFQNSDVRDKVWLPGIGVPAAGQAPSLAPFLTARPTTARPAGGIAGNPGVQLDPDGEGALRLTTNIGNQAAFVLYNNPITTVQGLTVTFEIYAYGGRTNPERADGFNFFLLDGTASTTEAGAFGGSLGYAQKIGISPGVKGGYFGVGLDEYGNYSSATDSPGGAVVRVGGNPAGRTRDSIAIRGSEAANYNYLGGTGTLPFGIDVPTATTRDQAKRTVQVDLTSTGLLNVRIDSDNDGDFLDPGETSAGLTNVDIAKLTGTPLPSTIKFGFAAGTGDFNNIHEIRNLVITTKNNPPVVAAFGEVVPRGTTQPVNGFSATDPDVPDGDSIASFQILTLPDPSQGTLYLGNPASGGVPITANTAISPTDIQRIYFRATPGFEGATFTYTATDTRFDSATPATVTLSPRNLPPNTNASSLTLPQNTTKLVPGLSGVDTDGTIASYTIVTVPPASEGKLFLGDPAQGGTQIRAGQVLTPVQLQQVYFQSSSNFDGSSFTYAATDNFGQTDPTPAVVGLFLGEVNPVLCRPGRRLKGTSGPDDLKGGPNINTIKGFAGNDRLRGFGCNDVIDGGTGNDRISGGTERDVLRGQQGNDRAWGNEGDDVINQGLGNDWASGGLGLDSIVGGRGRDTLWGRWGNDTLKGGRDNDTVDGGANDDLIDGQQNNDSLVGDKGRDTLNGGLGNDKIRSGPLGDQSFGRRGNDVIWGGPGRDTLQGNQNDDKVTGNQQIDRLNGGLGNDVINGGPGNDIIRTGRGKDRVVYGSANQGVDQIVDFDVANDRIDIRSIFRNTAIYTQSNRFAKYVRVRDGANGAVVRVDSNGNAAGGFVPLAVLQGVSATGLTSANFLVV